jgi:hypothetical protein
MQNFIPDLIVVLLLGILWELNAIRSKLSKIADRG